MSTPSSTTAGESNANHDPARLTLPPVDTSMRIWRNISVKEAKFYAPGIVLAGLALLAGLYGSLAVGVVGMLIAGIGLTLGGVGHALDRWWTSAPDRLRATARYVHRCVRLPFGDADSDDLAGLHGVRRITDDGTVVRDGGARVALLRVRGTNTAMQTADEDDDLGRALGRALDEDIKTIDIEFHSTTRPADLAAAVDPLAERAGDDDASMPTTARAYLEDVTRWTREVDGTQWGAHQWRHYALVRVVPDEIDTRLRDRLPFIDSDRTPESDRLESHLDEKVARVRDALAGVDGLTVEGAGPSEAADMIGGYWRGRGRVPSDDRIDRAVDGDTGRALAPDVFDQDGTALAVGDERCRTVWIAEWPPDPDPMFLRDLYTARGVHLDVHVSLTALDKRTTADDLNEETAQVDAETLERQEQGDISALDAENDIDHYLRMRELLRETSAQPWRAAAYVTIRADDADALAHAEDVVEKFDALRAAKQAALEDATGALTRLLEGEPANCLPVVSRTRQLDAFQAAAPTTPDAFAEAASAEVRSRMLGGMVGGMFPFCATTPTERDGLDVGRNEQTMQPMKVDPFERGSAPHLLTLGKSRSGKTFAVSRAVARWYLQSEDHHLIVCDTQNGFHGLTELLDGKHIVIDGSSTVNPLDIRPVPGEQRAAMGAGASPYRLKIEEATEFVLGILRSQGVPDPGEYAATIEHALETTYNEADIYPGQPASHANPSPTMGDFIDTLGRMLEEPDAFTFTGHEREIDRKVGRAADLLDRLSGLREGQGKYHDLVGETDAGLLEDDVDMAYLDLRQLQGASDAAKSTMLHLMLGQVSQKIKRIDGECLFVIDEAHMLLHSEEMTRWLQKAAREWARYDAGLWFVSQSPREFVEQSAERDSEQENQRRTIVDQCSMIQLFYTELADVADGRSETLHKLGLNEVQDRFVRRQAARGKNNDYSESLLHLTDHRGWFPIRTEASPFEQYILEYAPHDGDPAFEEYLARYPGKVPLSAPVDGLSTDTAIEGAPEENGDDLLARVEVERLEEQVAELETQLATKDERIEELETRAAALRDELLQETSGSPDGRASRLRAERRGEDGGD